MKHCFVLNPVAGARNAEKVWLPRILAAVKEAGVEFEIHRTINVGDAAAHVRELCEKAPGARQRFYACGGDGTLNEVVNGLYGFENVELASVPIGSGNDFVRNFGTKPLPFLDFSAQIAGTAAPVDVMRYEFAGNVGSGGNVGLDGSPDGSAGHGILSYQFDKPEHGIGARGDSGSKRRFGYAINMLNMGFDANVVKHMTGFKRLPFLSGTAAYVAGVAKELARFRMIRASVAIDGGAPFDTEILLSGTAGGRFSGGGFDGMPMARVDDGLLDVMVITPLSRREFLSLVGKYHDGKHIEDPRMEGKYFHWRCKEAVYTPKDGMTLSIDGETMFTKESLRIAAAEKSVRFSLPAGVALPL
jgi:diacylglycerol kinase family enzyme